MIELLVALVIATLIFMGWQKISNFQSIRKEALRRMAVEEASGLLDYMTWLMSTNSGYYAVSFDTINYVYTNAYRFANSNTIPLFGAADPIRYRLKVTASGTKPVGMITNGVQWAIIELYDVGELNPTNDPPFSSMSILLKR